MARDLEAFYTYGAPLSTPDGAFTGELVAPGVGGPLEDAKIKTGPVADADLGENPELHLEVLDPEHQVIAAVDVDRVDRSQGMGGGFRAVLRETNGIFELEERWNLKEMTESRHLRTNQIEGLPVTVALAGLRFLGALEAPNRLRISARHGSRERGVIDEHVNFDWDDEQRRTLQSACRILEKLALLQAHSDAVIRTLDFAEVTREQFRSWQIAAALLAGEEISGKYAEGHALLVDLTTEVDVDGTFGVSLPHSVRVGAQDVNLGRYELVLENPTLVR